MTCGHEEYLDLIEKLEQKDYASARAMIDSMEHKTAIPSTEGTEGETEAATIPLITQPEVDTNVMEIELDYRNLLDYFEIQEDYIFESSVICHQSIRLREEYESRLVDIRNVTVQVSFFDAQVYGEVDHGDQLFFSDYYTMTTGELEFQTVDVDRNGEAFLSQTTYDTKARCFDSYMMDIAISEASGTLILAEE